MNQRMIYFMYAHGKDEHPNVYEDMDPQACFADASAPHSRPWVASCPVERSANVFHAARHGWDVQRRSVVCSSHLDPSPKESFGNRFHRWNCRNGIRDRVDRRRPHPIAQEILDGDALRKPLRRFHPRSSFV